MSIRPAMSATSTAAALALGSGAAASVQVAVQSQVALRIGALEAAMLAAIIGTTTTACVLILVHQGIGGLRNVGELPWWMFIGGILGTTYVFSMAVAGARIGIVATVALFLSSQLTVATLIDGFGWLRTAQVHVTPTRIAGIVFLAVGAALTLRR